MKVPIYLKTLFSPFKPLKLKFYFGKVALGCPYFLPRRFVKSKDKPGYKVPIAKKVGFDFVKLGWKTKWSGRDYRFEWSPKWSFVFFGFQFCISFIAPEQDHYWECWLYYDNNTDKSKSKRERIKQCREEHPCSWTSYSKAGEKEEIDYYEFILKNKYLK